MLYWTKNEGHKTLHSVIEQMQKIKGKLPLLFWGAFLCFLKFFWWVCICDFYDEIKFSFKVGRWR